MKIISAATGSTLPATAFTLGQAGRGRHVEEIRIDARNPPQGDDVGFAQFGGKEGWEKGVLQYEHNAPHVVLTQSSPKQKGILLVIRTEGTYTRGCSKNRDEGILHKGGSARLLTAGVWAWGDAGNTGSGRDELWHVEEPSIFAVYLAGGAEKGYGWRYVIITKKFEVKMMKLSELCQLIATDENPDIVEVVRSFSDKLNNDIKSAVEVADRLEEAMDAPSSPVTHFVSEHTTIEALLNGWQISVPAVFKNGVGGVSGVQAGTIIPGSKALVFLEIGPGGGKRYGFKEVSESGISRLKEGCGPRGTTKAVLGRIEDPTWHSAWINFKDGEVDTYVMANGTGIHLYVPNPSWGEKVRTIPWAGISPITPTEAEIRKVFGLDEAAVEPANPEIANEPPKEVTLADLRTKFGKR